MDWFKHDIPAWMNDTETLDHGSYRVYHVICQLIYLHEGPIKRNERGIAGRCNMHILALRAHLNHLISSGKLTVNLDGTLDQPRTNLEIHKVRLARDRSNKSLKNNDPTVAAISLEESRKEKSRKEKKDSCPSPAAMNGTATILSIIQTDWPSDFCEQFWDAYPRHIEKPPALKKLTQLKASGKLPWKVLIDGVSRYAESVRGKDKQYIKHPAAWLNTGRWGDEVEPQKPKYDGPVGWERA